MLKLEIIKILKNKTIVNLILVIFLLVILIDLSLINNFTFEYLGLYINSSNATKLEENINKYIKNNNYNNSVYNIETEVKAQRAFIILISIFLYGFIIE